MNTLKEKEDINLKISAEKYRESIIRMVKVIESLEILELIQGFVESGYNEERAGRA